MSEAQLEAERRAAHERAAGGGGGASGDAKPVSPAIVVGAWLLVGIPLAWGVLTTIGKAARLFE
jgi:hypothetical protein